MILSMIGAHCEFPRRPYNPADLPAEYHTEVVEYLRRAALKWLRQHTDKPVGVPAEDFRKGLEDRAEECAAEAYAFWLSRTSDRLPAGAHRSAVAGVRRWFDRSGWKGATGYKRAKQRQVTDEYLAYCQRLRERNQPTPATVVVEWGGSLNIHKNRRKAVALAERLGLRLEDLARLANGLAIESGEHRPRRVHPAPIPAPLPDPFPAERTGMTTVDARHGWVVKPDPSGTLPEVRYAGATTRESEG